MREILSVSKFNTEIRVFDANGNAKQLWQENRLGKALRKAGMEVRIPGVTGSKSYVQRNHNLIVNSGHAMAAGLLANQGSYTAAGYLALGTGTTAAVATDTALETELTASGLGRAAATVSISTTNVTNDTAVLTHTWTASGSGAAITEEGVFNAASAGTLLARQTFAAVNVASGDSIQVTHQISC